jgi:hypothetical protein
MGKKRRANYVHTMDVLNHFLSMCAHFCARSIAVKERRKDRKQAGAAARRPGIHAKCRAVLEGAARHLIKGSIVDYLA